MRQPRPINPKKIVSMGSDAPSPAASLAGAPLSEIPNPDARVIRDAEQNLASADSVEHDSKIVLVTDDWPSSVPITPEEVDVIEAFFKREIDALLR
ncbi:hypothetical protein MWN33_18965 [Starkeya koreensis]|uniref:Uncharacterized protein n=1 Tax=Ancylobacter koreensis TaxID=266121 RepID=A0ABT0DS66_9HYPH|nr:hypothetical protein [Ancylobacter koreensis]MCK0210116.1 hypothetical protein [Ancylobacter koreensis]